MLRKKDYYFSLEINRLNSYVTSLCRYIFINKLAISHSFIYSFIDGKKFVMYLQLLISINRQYNIFQLRQYKPVSELG